MVRQSQSWLSHLLHRRRHLVDRRGGLFDFLALLVQATGGVFGDRTELLGSGSQLAGGLGNTLDGLAQVFLHALERLLQARASRMTGHAHDVIDLEHL